MSNVISMRSYKIEYMAKPKLEYLYTLFDRNIHIDLASYYNFTNVEAWNGILLNLSESQIRHGFEVLMKDIKNNIKFNPGIIKINSKIFAEAVNTDYLFNDEKISLKDAYEDYIFNKDRELKVWRNAHIKYAFDKLRFMNFTGCDKGEIKKTFEQAYMISKRKDDE